MVEAKVTVAGDGAAPAAAPAPRSGAMETAVSRKRSAVPSAAAVAAPKKRPEAALVFLRVKRRRTDTPVARLVVQGEEEKEEEEEHKQEEKATVPAAQRELLKAFTKLSTKEKSFVFTHIDTMEAPLTSATSHSKWTERLKKKARSLKDEHAELRARPAASPFLQDASLLSSGTSASTRQRAPMIQKQQKLARERRQSDAQRARGLLENDKPVVEIKERGTVELPGVRLVDLEAVRVGKNEATEETEAKATATSTPSVTVNGARLRPTRVLNPGERELDEAIWAAFQRNDFSRFFAILNSQRPEIRTKPAMFQRPADGGSALMAAALHGRADVIEVLLRHSPASVLLQDWEGVLASTFARRGGHESVEKALLACEEAEHDKEFVYDVYCVDVSQDGADVSKHPASSPTATDAVMGDGQTAQVPIVTVSSAVQQWLSQDAGPQADEVEEYMLESDAGSHEGSDDESVDSNDEDFFANDYPDEESSDSDVESDGWDEIGGPKRFNAAQDDYTERDDGDY